jgi:3-oxoacyl-[acyl-carrier-protein] synthase-1
MAAVASIVSVELFGAVGLSTAEFSAAVRAGTARFTENAVRDRRFKGVVAATVPADALPPLPDALGEAPLPTARELRLARLAMRPLAACVARLAAAGVRPALFLAIPEATSSRPVAADVVLEMVTAPVRPQLAPAGHSASYRGRAGGLAALGDAIAAVSAGRIPAAIVGGIDTYIDLVTLGRLAATRRLKTDANFDGFIPGEGAAFVAIASDHVMASQRLPRLARVGPVALGEEPGHLGSPNPFRGDGLAATVRSLVALAAPEQPVGEVYSSMNGESHWSKEWGVAFLRNRAAFDPDHGMRHPSDCYGDVGAATGPMLVGLAADGLSRGYRTGSILVYASSDSAARAATIVTAAAG